MAHLNVVLYTTNIIIIPGLLVFSCSIHIFNGVFLIYKSFLIVLTLTPSLFCVLRKKNHNS